jgi:hypothetical protein
MERCETRSSRCFVGASKGLVGPDRGSEQMIKNSVSCQCAWSRDIKLSNPTFGLLHTKPKPSRFAW